jgi:hypothetical protein
LPQSKEKAMSLTGYIPRQHIAKKKKELHSFTMCLPCGQWKKIIAPRCRLRTVAQ